MQISSVWGYSIYQVKNKTALTNTVIKWPRIIDQQLAVYHRTYAKILVDKRNLILYFHFSLKAHCLLDFKQIITLNLTVQVIYVYRYLIHVQYDFSCSSSAFWHSINLSDSVAQPSSMPGNSCSIWIYHNDPVDRKSQLIYRRSWLFSDDMVRISNMP